jgi:CRISPR/Cas system CSM-associated protein Csm3 (group 7 of RAMP superfamily)
MKRQYKIKLLSDLVLKASANNEGNIRYLDYIPGSAILGIVAREYESFENPFDVFHSGKVKFKDATILINGKKSYKVPLSFYYEKLNPKSFYNIHLLDDIFSKGQLKQKRSGYINEGFDFKEVELRYSQKSAYDKKQRRSKDGSMFGYKSIEKGSEFVFEIEYEGVDIEQIEKALLGKRHLGKSKSAEYGYVKISKIEGIKEVKEDFEKLENVALYFNSKVALFDNEGNPTTDVKWILDGVEVDYSKTQIKLYSYIPYNEKRKYFDSERFCIDKGSVVVLKRATKEQLKRIKRGVGAFLSEGFGDVLVNPSFLQKEEFSLKKVEIKDEVENSQEGQITLFLKQRKEKEEYINSILKEADEFVNNYKDWYKLSSSQWGRIRAICRSFDNPKEEIREYLDKKIKKELIDLLVDKDIRLIELIAMNFQKELK